MSVREVGWWQARALDHDNSCLSWSNARVSILSVLSHGLFRGPSAVFQVFSVCLVLCMLFFCTVFEFRS